MADEDVATAAAPETPPATAPEASPTDEVATLKRQLATLQGQSQALDRKVKEAEQLAHERDELSRKLAEREAADMTEFEKAQAKAKSLEEKLAQTNAELAKAKLSAKYPKAVEFFGEDALPSEDRLAELEKTLTPKPETKPEEPVTPPPPNPRKPTGPTDNKTDVERLREQVTEEARRLFGRTP